MVDFIRIRVAVPAVRRPAKGSQDHRGKAARVKILDTALGEAIRCDICGCCHACIPTESSGRPLQGMPSILVNLIAGTDSVSGVLFRISLDHACRTFREDPPRVIQLATTATPPCCLVRRSLSTQNAILSFEVPAELQSTFHQHKLMSHMFDRIE